MVFLRRFDVALDKSPKRIQKIVDEAQVYYSDGWTGYIDVIYPSEQRKRQIKHIYGRGNKRRFAALYTDFSKTQ